MTKCRQRAKDSVWWRGIRKDIEETVTKCPICCRQRAQHAEPLMPSQLPVLLRQKIATDLFERRKVDYLLVVDCYSRYIEVEKLTSTTAASVISHLKSILSRHDIPETVMLDNGPQYSASVFTLFAKEYGFKRITSSPKYLPANGAAEQAVKTVKQLLEKNSDQVNACIQINTTRKWI